ncbi:rRNA adenine N-6-methyltransferase family protein [Streptomyces sp. NPDC048623]|uniref:rRNA adenine N-6-methyltransferase family protein n=1 Tax=Streptomyces sp. NPDC048623 TaxID=3155761 RepID=UPI00343BE09F
MQHPSPTVPAPADRFASHGFQVRDDLGQHFLRHPEAAAQLLERGSLPAESQVLEVGAGLGTLSRAIVTAGHRIWAVEKDHRLLAQLTEQLHGFEERAVVTIGDVRQLDLTAGLSEGSSLVSIMPFDPELSVALIRHVFSSPKVVRGLVVLPSAGATRLSVEDSGTLCVEEVDGIGRGDFWPPAPMVLRVVRIVRAEPCRS